MKLFLNCSKIAYAIIAIILGGISSVVAIPNNTFHTIYTSEYSHLNECYSITQSTDKYIWISHSLGVARYDGSQLKNYKQSYNFGRKIIKLSGGNVLSYANKESAEICLYDEISDKFTPLDSLMGNMLLNKRINGYTTDDRNNIWFALNSGIITYNGDSGRWLYYEDFVGVNITMVVSIGENILFMTDNNIWLAYPNSKTKKLEIKYTVSANINSIIESVLYDDKAERIYIGTSHKGLFVYNLIGKTLSEVLTIDFAGAPVRALQHYTDQYLLVGTDGLGIFMLDSSDLSIKQHYFKSDTDQTHSIESNAIYGIYVDQEQRIYCATYAHGVLVLDPNAVNYKRQAPNHQLNTTVNVIYEDEQHNMWIGTNDGCFLRNHLEQEWQKINFHSSVNIANRVILAFASDGEDVYATGYGGGLLKVDRYSRTIKPVPHRGGGISPRLVFAIAYDSHGGFWLGSQNETLIYYDIKTESFEHYGRVTNITSIGKISSDKFLYIEDFTPYYIDSNTHQISSFVYNDEFIEELGVYPSSVCARVKDNIVYFATRNCGLISYNIETKEFESFEHLLGSDYSCISSLEIDSDGNIYLITSEGLVFVDSDRRFAKNIMRDNQSVSITPIKRASLLTSYGSIMLGTQAGPLEIIPSQAIYENHISSPVLTDFRVDYNSILAFAANHRISEPISQIEQIELLHNQNTFSFHFTQIDFSRFEKPHFSWKLEGVDDAWHPITSKNSAEYNNIAPGKYTFNLCVVSPHNNQNYASRKIRVIIRSPWYWNIYSIIAYIIIALIALTGVIYLYIRHIKQKQSQDKINFFINTSHDIRTPLTLIKAPLENLRQDTSLSAPSRYMLWLVTRNVDKIYDMINRLLDFEQFSTRHTEAQVQEVSLNDYLRMQVDRFWGYALTRKVDIKLALQQPNIVIAISAEYLDKIIDNLLSNAIKYSKPGGEVTLESQYNDAKLYLIVKDNGIGIPQKQQNRLFKQIYRADNAINSKQIGSGVGLLYASQLIKTMGGEISFESVEDSYTTFTVKLPIITKGDTPIDKSSFSEFDGESDASIDIESSQSRANNLTPILIVDDNDEILEYFAQSLSQVYNVYVADSAGRAMEIIVNQHIEVVVTDVMMPEVNGYELCKQIKSKSYLSHILIIMLSALSTKDDILKGLSYGADDYITKPFELADLKKRIADVINSRKRLSQHFSTNNVSDEKSVEQTSNDNHLSQQYYNEVDKLFLEQIDKHIEANISNADFNINELCRALCVSRSVFYNRLKNLTNLTPSDMLRKKRMEYAMQLLSEHNHSIREVADLTGFSDYKYFSKVFSRYFGILPSKICRVK